jgi:hypothetical protein
MNAHRIETVLSEDRTLMLQGLPFHMGDAVEVIILERSRSVPEGESTSPSEKAMEDRPNSLGMDRLFISLYRELGFLESGKE